MYRVLQAGYWRGVITDVTMVSSHIFVRLRRIADCKKIAILTDSSLFSLFGQGEECKKANSRVFRENGSIYFEIQLKKTKDFNGFFFTNRLSTHTSSHSITRSSTTIRPLTWIVHLSTLHSFYQPRTGSKEKKPKNTRKVHFFLQSAMRRRRTNICELTNPSSH